MAEISIGKLRREAVEHRYGKMEMDPRDVIVLCDRIESAERRLVEIADKKETDESVKVAK